jgi:Carboxypeptidase regulatory-like domain/TonB dependent receptor
MAKTWHHLLNMRVVTLLLCLTAGLFGQLASTTSLVGNVNDAAGAAIAGAEVVALNADTREALATRTSSEGYYEFPFIKAGTYEITVKQSGFDAFTKTGIVLSSNQTVRTDFAMKVGQVTEKLVVTAEVPAIATDDAVLSETIDNKRTQELPLNGRDALKLAITTPTVIPGLKSPAGNPGGGEGFIGAGTREIQNSMSLDGVSIMNNLITTTTFRPNVDAVQEMQIQTGTYAAQYGGYMGVQINAVSKTGTNSLHGSLFEYVRNNYFDARNFFENPTRAQAPFRQNQFGFELGGPIVIPKLYNGRNKTFFMGSYEGLRNYQGAPGTGTVFTSAERTGNFSELLPGKQIIDPSTQAPFAGNVIPPSRLSSQALKALQYLPLATGPGLVNNFTANAPNINNTDQTIDRLDQSFGDKTRLFFRYASADSALVNGNLNPNNGYNQPVTDLNWVVGWTQVFKSTLVNDARFGRQHTTIDSVNFFHTPDLANAGTNLGIPGYTTDLANSGLPAFTITGYTSIGADNMSSSNWYQTDTTWHGTDVLNWTHGAHSLSAGAEIRKLITLRTANNNPRGGFSFSGTITGNAAADFMLGLPISITTPGALFPGSVAGWRDGFFVMDKWQVNQKLTVTYGLRYELPTVPASINGNGRILDPTQSFFIPTNPPQSIGYNNPNHKNFAPRLGFAYRASPKWVARGGFGIYYNANQLNTYTLAITNPPYSNIFTYSNNPTSPTLSLANPTPPTIPGLPARVNAFTINPNLPPAYMNQWSFSIERALWRNAGLDIQYLGSHSLHLDRSYRNNAPTPGPGAVDARRPNQIFLDIRTIQNDEIANYEGLSVVFRQQTTHGLSALMSYTWSHTLDVTTDSNGGGQPMNPYNWRQDYGNSNWDLKHRFIASYLYELPFLKSSSSAVVRYVLSGWQLNGITIAQSGLPFTVNVSGDPANIGSSSGAAQRPNQIGPMSTNCGSGHITNCIDPSAFAQPAAYTFGSLGRNTLRGPGLVNFDFSIFKNFAMTERARIQLRAESFNILNHPNFSNPSATFGTGSFGSIGTTSTNNRQLQLAVKILF